MSSQNENPSDHHEENEEIVQKQSSWRTVWQNNKGAAMILFAEVFGSSSEAMVRFLQQGRHGMHPFQVIFARMSVTLILSLLYMWWTEVPNAPLGPKSVRLWLFLRAVFGFGGLFCLYYSVHWLPLAEATVFRFLVPIVTAWACSVFLGLQFRRTDVIAGIIALLGVVIIAHPKVIFEDVDDGISPSGTDTDEVSPTQRLLAILVSIIGVVGAAGAYTVVRLIGNQAHALISVTYFAALCVFGSTVALMVVPGISFIMLQGPREWLFVFLLGLFGFGLQFLLTAGLQLDRSSKATSMLYSQVLYALLFDWSIWGVIPGTWSIVGGLIVIASTLWSALQTSAPQEKPVVKAGEESPLLGSERSGAIESPR